MNYWVLFSAILVTILVLGTGGILLVGIGLWNNFKDFIGWWAGVVGWAALLTADVWLINHV